MKGASNKELILQIKHTIKQPYAWPGGYPLFAVCSDGGALCSHCLKSELGLIVTSIAQGLRNGWRVTAIVINWEDTDLHCDHCWQPIESAYGEDHAKN